MILERFAKENRFPNLRFFVDDGYTGTSFERPGFLKMLEEIEADRVGVVIVKNLSRFVKNSAMAGMYINFTFAEHGVRFIAINDNYDTIDPNSVDNDFAGIKNWFNEFYARDTSRKIRAVNKAKGERGERLTTNVPYGCIRDPENKGKWLVDEEAAAVVKRIFSLCMEGRGPMQIGKLLREEKILNPTAYKVRKGRSSSGKESADPYYWNTNTVVHILERQEYTGCTVNFKTYTNSIWDKKQRDNPAEKQAVFYGTYEPLISIEVFDKVQKIRQQRHRRTKTGKSSLFPGLVYCADCKAKMRYCTTSYFEKRLQTESAEAIRVQRKRLSQAEKRITELDRLYIKIYEDNASGRLSDEQFFMMGKTYEDEQARLKTEAARLQEEIEVQERQSENLEQFIQRVRKYTDLGELTPYALRELVSAIYAENPYPL